MYKVFFITFGCKVNQYETDKLRGCFACKGFQNTDNAAEADVIIVNSCTVTGSGDSKSLYSVRKLKKEHPDSVIVLTGCFPQASPETAASITEADIVTGTKDRAGLPELVLSALEKKRHIVDIQPYSASDRFEEIGAAASTGKTRAFIKIQDGCNCFCSYCMIPYARGRFRSKAPEALKAEAEKLAKTGHKEIVLVGINIAFYGIETGLRLVDAVELCCGIDGIERVRLGSIEPEMISESDLARLAELPQFCPQFHLSLQSGSRTVLERMNRRYTPSEYEDIVRRIRRYFPDAAFTTDIMVGFPGETEEEFAESMRFAERIGFAGIHVFQYSPRRGTPAAGMKQLPESVKHERAERMKSLASALSKKYMDNLVGKTVPVLFEREKSAEFHQGHAPDHTLIKISRKNPKKSLRNSVFYVTIEEAHTDYCIGCIKDNKSE